MTSPTKRPPPIGTHVSCVPSGPAKVAVHVGDRSTPKATRSFPADGDALVAKAADWAGQVGAYCGAITSAERGFVHMPVGGKVVGV